MESNIHLFISSKESNIHLFNLFISSKEFMFYL